MQSVYFLDQYHQNKYGQVSLDKKGYQDSIFVSFTPILPVITTDTTIESFQLQMGFSFPFLRANDLRTSFLIMRTGSLSYVGLFLNLIANAVNNNNQHVRSGTNVRMSQNPHQRQKRMGVGIIIARRTTITICTGQGRAARQLHRGYIRIGRTPTQTFHIGF